MNHMIHLSGALILSLALLSGCDLSADDKADSKELNPTSHEVEGRAAKGIIRDGHVVFDELIEGEWVEAGTAWTDQQGRFETDVQISSDVVRITVNAESSTTMTCDAVDGCDGGIAFGDYFHVDPSFSMMTIIPAAALSEPVSINPLTHIGALWVDDMPLITPQSIEVSQNRISSIFGVGKEFHQSHPIDISNNSEVVAATTEERKVALILSALANLNGGMDSTVSVMNQFSEAFMESGGQFPTQALDHIASQVTYSAAEIGSDLDTPAKELVVTLSAWTGDLTEALLEGQYDTAVLDDVSGILNEVDGHLHPAGINDQGTFMADRRDDYAWFFSDHQNYSRQTLLVGNFASFTAALMSDIAIEHDEHRDDIKAMFDPWGPGLTIGTGDMVHLPVDWARNGDHLALDAHLTPLLQGARAGGHHYELDNAQVTSAQTHIAMDALLETHIHDPDTANLFNMTMETASPYHEGPDTHVLEAEIRNVMDQLDLGADLSLSALFDELADSTLKIDADLDVSVNVDMLAHLTGHPNITITIHEAAFSTPAGDSISVPAHLGGLSITLDDSTSVEGKLVVEGFGFPEAEISLDLHQSLDPTFRDSLIDVVASAADRLDQGLLKEVATMLAPELAKIEGQSEISVASTQQTFTLIHDQGGVTVSVSNRQNNLVFYPSEAMTGYIYNGDTLLGVAYPTACGTGTRLDLMDGSTRVYRVDGEPQEEEEEGPRRR